MAPLVEFSVSGIQASVHGRMEALSSTTNFTLSATTYNGKYDAWEPLIEPCDTFVR
jgi:vacuolar protein sorting-associated protein 13A/C